jgi:PAS domain-containing protein
VPLPLAGPLSFIQRDYAQQLLRTGEFSTGEPFKGPITGRWVVPLVFPRRDAADHLIGWVASALDVESIGDILARGRTDRSDVIVLSSSQSRVISRSTDVAKWVGSDVREHPLGSALLGGAPSVWRGAGLDGTARIWGAADVPLAGWKVIVGLDEAKSLAPANAALARNSVLTVLILLLAAVLAFATSHAIAAPIQALAQTVGRIAGGERGLRSPLTGATEIDRIALELNRMLDALDRSEAESTQATAALRDREKTLRLVTETIDEVFWMADIAIKTMHYISPGYERVWGRTRESLCEDPRSFIDTVHPDDRDRLLTALESHQTGNFTSANTASSGPTRPSAGSGTAAIQSGTRPARRLATRGSRRTLPSTSGPRKPWPKAGRTWKP